MKRIEKNSLFIASSADFIVKNRKGELINGILMFIVPYVLMLYIIIVKKAHQFEILYIFGLFTLMFIILFVFHNKFYIEVKNGELIHHYFFMEKRIKIKDIEIAREEVGKDGFKPFFRLTIIPKKDINMKEFYIANYFLEREGYKRLLKVLSVK